MKINKLLQIAFYFIFCLFPSIICANFPKFCFCQFTFCVLLIFFHSFCIDDVTNDEIRTWNEFKYVFSHYVKSRGSNFECVSRGKLHFSASRWRLVP